MKLTLRQQAFCDYYIESGNATEAAIKAGYSKKTAKETGYENLTKPHLRNYIDERVKELGDTRIAKAEEILQFLTEVQRNEEVEMKDRIKAAELLGKRQFLWSDKEKRDAEIKKLQADTELIEARTKLLKGATKDTTLMEALISAVKGE